MDDIRAKELAEAGILDLEDYIGRKRNDWTREDISFIDILLGTMQSIVDSVATINRINDV